MLELGLISRTRFQSPSTILQIDDPLTAFGLDAAVAGVMLEWENKRDYKRLESLIKSLYAMIFAWFGKKWVDPDSGKEEVPEDEML